jgi:hypothetical protein
VYFSCPLLIVTDSWIFQVQALYDFTGEPGTAELSITAGEVLTVTRQNVGEGWWEGVNQAGQTGLFPAAYVEVRLCVCYHFLKPAYRHWLLSFQNSYSIKQCMSSRVASREEATVSARCTF